jgi:hypothetical protein
VLLKADQPVGNYWLDVVVVNGTRTGSPAGYGVLRYVGANATMLPQEPILQPETVPAWPLSFYKQVNCAIPCQAQQFGWLQTARVPLLPASSTCPSSDRRMQVFQVSRMQVVPAFKSVVLLRRGVCARAALQIRLPGQYLDPNTVPQGTVLPAGEASLMPPNRTKTIHLNLTQPLLPSGQLR